MTEDEMVGWHHRLNGHGFGWTLGVGDAVHSSHPLLSPYPRAVNLSQHLGLSNESVLRIRWPKCWSFSFSISRFSEYSGLISFRIHWLDLLEVQGTI